jgi:hypothetical protein
MAITSAGNRGTGASTADGTTLNITHAAVSSTVGQCVILTVACDNVGTTDADHDEIQGITDTGSNTWSKLGEFTNGQGASNAGTTVSVWMSKITTQLDSGNTITVTFKNTIEAKTASAWAFDVGANKTLSVVQTDTSVVDAGNGWGTATISGLSSLERLYFHGLSKESNSLTQITVTSGFTAITNQRSGSGATATEQIVRGEWDIDTSTGSSSTPVLANATDAAGVFMALEEVDVAVGGHPAMIRGSGIPFMMPRPSFGRGW